MDQNSLTQPSNPLSSDDLAEIDRFHTAWCYENKVAKTDVRAIEVASALIDWYSTDPPYRLQAKFDNPPILPQSKEIESLMALLK